MDVQKDIILQPPTNSLGGNPPFHDDGKKNSKKGWKKNAPNLQDYKVSSYKKRSKHLFFFGFEGESLPT